MKSDSKIANYAVYTILTQDGLPLEVGELSHQDGGVIRLWSQSGGAAQQWQFEEVLDGYYKIANLHSGKVLDVAMQGTQDGTAVHQWEYIGADSQLWRVDEAGNGLVKLICKHADKCLDLASLGTEAGTTVHIWHDVDGASQRWRLEQVSGTAESPKSQKAKDKIPATKKPAGKGAKKSTHGKTLQAIHGVGPKTAQVLMREFKTLGNVKKAGLAALEAVKGVTKPTALNIYNHFKKQDEESSSP